MFVHIGKMLYLCSRKRKRNNPKNQKAMIGIYENPDQIPETIWEYVEAFFEEKESTTEENNSEKTETI